MKASEGHAGKLATLIAIEDFGGAVFTQSPLNPLDAEAHAHADREPPGQYPTAEPVHVGRQVEEAARHGI